MQNKTIASIAFRMSLLALVGCYTVACWMPCNGPDGIRRCSYTKPVTNGDGAMDVSIRISADKDTVALGRSVRIDAVVVDAQERPIPNYRLYPFVNGKRWGSHELTDETGKAYFLIPFPNEGPQRIEVLGRLVRETFAEKWIWLGEPQADQTIFLRRDFDLKTQPDRAQMWITADDSFKVSVNGHDLGGNDDWANIMQVDFPQEILKAGRNEICVSAHNSGGPGGVVARLDMETDGEASAIVTEASWQGWFKGPDGWPDSTTQDGTAVTVMGSVDEAPWGSQMKTWPGTEAGYELTIAGRPMPQDGTVSDPIQIDVTHRAIRHPMNGKEQDSFFGAQWEPWFTPMNPYWHTAQAVPLVGFYDSWNLDVCRQHTIWMVESGVDFIIPDWSNHLWEKKHWDERNDNSNEIIHATTMMLEANAILREEGHDFLQVAFFPGLINGPPTTQEALQEELDWIYHNYVRNPRFKGLFQLHEGKPLVLILDTVNYSGENSIVFDDDRFAIRFMGAQLDITQHDKLGFWSWMDGVDEPVVTYRDGEAEAVTVSIGYFSTGGWLRPTARGHQGGSTFVDTFKPALKHRPKFIQLHQFQEFAGQPEGAGHGPDKDIYVDSYSVELSDDMEPASLTAKAYRGDGAWGFRYMNLTRALIDLYHGLAPDDTILVVRSPIRREEISDSTMRVRWSWVGSDPESFSILLDGAEVAAGINGNEHMLDVTGLSAGSHDLTVRAVGAQTHYPLSEGQMDDPLSEPISPSVNVAFQIVSK